MDKSKLEYIYNEIGTIVGTAKYFNCSYGKIRYQLDKYNIEYQLQRNTKNISFQDLKEVYDNTQSIREVGKYFSMSHEKARQLLKKYNYINKPVIYNCNKDFFLIIPKNLFIGLGLLLQMDVY